MISSNDVIMMACFVKIGHEVQKMRLGVLRHTHTHTDRMVIFPYVFGSFRQNVQVTRSCRGCWKPHRFFFFAPDQAINCVLYA